MEGCKYLKRFALHFSIFSKFADDCGSAALSLQMIAAQPPKKANWSRKTIAIQDSFLPLSL